MKAYLYFIESELFIIVYVLMVGDFATKSLLS